MYHVLLHRKGLHIWFWLVQFSGKVPWQNVWRGLGVVVAGRQGEVGCGAWEKVGFSCCRRNVPRGGIFSQKIWIWEGVKSEFGLRLTAKLQIPRI